MIRLSDEAETGSRSALSGADGAQARALLDALPAAAPAQRRLPDDLRLGGRGGGGRRGAGRSRARLLRARRRRAARAARRAAPGSTAATTGPTCATSCSTSGYLVETLETSHTWSRLERALPGGRRRARRARCASQGTPGLVICHLSHAYRDGASLYFTFVARAAPRRRARAVARGQDAPPARRSSPPAATITHHHAVGRDHAPYMRPRWARLGLEALRAVKERLDPAGIMNPGKLLPGLVRAAGADAPSRPGAAALGISPAQDELAGLLEHQGGVLDRVADELADRRSPGRSRRRRAAPGRPAASTAAGIEKRFWKLPSSLDGDRRERVALVRVQHQPDHVGLAVRRRVEALDRDVDVRLVAGGEAEDRLAARRRRRRPASSGDALDRLLVGRRGRGRRSRRSPCPRRQSSPPPKTPAIASTTTSRSTPAPPAISDQSASASPRGPPSARSLRRRGAVGRGARPAARRARLAGQPRQLGGREHRRAASR